MFAALSNVGKASWFYAIALAVAVLAALGSSAAWGKWLIAFYMFSPLIAVLVVQFVVTQDWRNGWSWRSLGVTRAGLRAWPLAIAAPAIMLLAANFVVWSSGIGTFSWPPALGSPLTWLLFLIPHIAAGCVFAFGEEIGWRGYLLPKLVGIGILPAMLLTGFLHAMWHFPVILLTQFYHSEGSRWIVLPEFTILITLAGLFYGYLRYLTGSVWPAVITHATFNQLLEDFGLMTSSASPARLEYLGGESGLIPITVLAVIIVALLSSRQQGAPDAWGR